MLTSPGGVEDCCLLVQVFKADTTDPPKPSVLQWAGSSLKTITKKLRKASNPQPGFDSQLPMQQGAYAPQAASASLPAPASSDLIQDPPARLQLQISVPAAYHEHYAEQAVVSPSCSAIPRCLLLVPALSRKGPTKHAICFLAGLQSWKQQLIDHWVLPAELGAGVIAGGIGHT